MIDIRVKVDASEPKAALRKARREVGRRVKAALFRVGSRTVLPVARRRAWSIIADKIVIRSSTRGAWLTTSGRAKPWGQIAGLMEFGGTVRTIIRPRHREALSTPWGPRASVQAPRHYKPRGVLQFAVRQRLGVYEEGVVDEVARVFDGLDRA